MTMCASEIGTVPSHGFDWYIILLEGPFVDAIREQIDKHFLTLGREAGPRVLAVRGYDPTRFLNSFETAAFYGEGDWKNVELPAIVVTDAVRTAVESRDGLDKARIMIFPLRGIYERDKDISVFFGKLLRALRETDWAGVERLQPGTIQKSWSWLSEYVELNPSFLGFSLDVKKIIDGILHKLG